MPVVGCSSGYVLYPGAGQYIDLVVFKLAIISQGIAARYARRQASSEKAFIHPQFFPVVGRLARSILEDDGFTIDVKPKL